MNIFWLDDNLKLAAQAHCDKHVVKMCLEYAQLLSSANRVNSPEMCWDEFPYKLTHKNHPCAIWVRQSEENYNELKQLALYLGEEYTNRYGKEHKSIALVKELSNPKFKSFAYTEPPQCMPDEYKDNNVVKAYRNYYIGDKSRFATWKTQPPKWWSLNNAP